MSAAVTNPLTDEERQGLTIWGETISAQIRDESDGRKLALYIRDDAPRSPENGHPAIVSPSDVLKLRALLNEAETR